MNSPVSLPLKGKEPITNHQKKLRAASQKPCLFRRLVRGTYRIPPHPGSCAQNGSMSMSIHSQFQARLWTGRIERGYSIKCTGSNIRGIKKSTRISSQHFLFISLRILPLPQSPSGHTKTPRGIWTKRHSPAEFEVWSWLRVAAAGLRSGCETDDPSARRATRLNSFALAKKQVRSTSLRREATLMASEGSAGTLRRDRCVYTPREQRSTPVPTPLLSDYTPTS